MKQIPNLFTLLNLLLGCLAVIFILQNGIVIVETPEASLLIDVPEKIWMASLFIGLAALVDFADGFVARLLKASSTLGKQLDSLADLVSFGVAPGLIIYQFLRMSMMKDQNGMDESFIWLVPALLIPCAAAYRLANFNIDARQEYNFRGVPTPAVGLLIASFPLIYWYEYNKIAIDLLLNRWLLYGLIILLCFLMTGRFSMMSLKFHDFSLKSNLPKIVLLIITVVLVILLKWLAVPFIFLTYLIISLIWKRNDYQPAN